MISASNVLFLIVVAVLVVQLSPTLCNPMDHSPPGSSVHGILQARILEWVAISSSRGSSWPRDRTCISCIGRWSLYPWTTWEAHYSYYFSHSSPSLSGICMMCAERISEKEREKWRRRPCVTQELEVWVWRHKSGQWGKKRAVWRNSSTFTATVPGHWCQEERMEKSRPALTSKQIRWLHMPGQECGDEGGCLRKQGAPASTPALSSPCSPTWKGPSGAKVGHIWLFTHQALAASQVCTPGGTRSMFVCWPPELWWSAGGCDLSVPRLCICLWAHSAQQATHLHGGPF